MNNNSIKEKIHQYYIKYLDREPEESGLKNAFNNIKNNLITFEQLKSTILSSFEYKEKELKKSNFHLLVSKIKKPIFIIGVPRSGTGLFYHTLCSHPNLAWFCMDDLKIWMPDLQQEQLRKHYEKLKLKNKKFPADENALTIFGNVLFNPKDFEHLPLGPYPIEGETFWKKYLGHGFITDISLDKKLGLVQGIIDIMEKQNKSRFLNKAPQNIMRLPALKKIFPDSIFINIARDPRSVVSSMIRRHNTEGSFETGISILDKQTYQELDFVQKWAWQYKEISEIILKFSQENPQNFHTVIYEEFLQNPVETVKKKIDLCQLQIPENFKQKIPKMREEPRKKWIKDITEEDSKKIFDIVGPIISKLNYPYRF